MPTAFPCPECRAVLQTKTELAPGTSVKCPKCESIFVVPEPDSGALPSQTAAVLPHIPLRIGAFQENEHLRAGRASRFPAPYPAPAPFDDETANYPPLRNRFHASSRRRNRTVLILGVVGGGGALLALVMSLIAPTFLFSKQDESLQEVAAANIVLPKGTGQEDLLSLVPPEFKLFAAANLGMIHQQPKWQVPWQAGMAAGLRRLPLAPRRLAELVTNTERVLVAVNLEPQMGEAPAPVNPEMLLVLRTNAPYTPQQMRELLGIENRPLLQVKNQRFFLIHANAQLAVAMHMVNDRVAIFAMTREQRLADVLNCPAAARAGDDLARTEARAVENALLWTAGTATPALRGWLARVDARALSIIAPELVPALAPLQNVKGGAAALDLAPNGTWSLRVRATCSAAAEAQQVQAACQDFWDKKARMYLNMARMFLPGDAQAGLAPLLDQLANNFKASAQGPEVELTLELSADALMQAMGQVNGLQPAQPGPALPLPGLPLPFPIPNPPLQPPGR
jgi:hypothetical protein